MNHVDRIATQLKIPSQKVAATIELLDAGNTLPFIARYRKEMTGGLDEEQISDLMKLLNQLRKLDERRQTVLASIEEQGKLTPELHQQLLAADSLTALEDLYQPYKPKRRTRAIVARERGLQGLADLILQQARTKESLSQVAAPFITDEVPTTEDALAGARDIVAETISDHAGVRRITREKAFRFGLLGCEKNPKAEDPRSVYQTYYEVQERVSRLRPHQVLAINRGESEGVLRVSVEVVDRDWQGAIASHFRPDPRSPFAVHLTLAADDAAQRLLLPTIERDVRRTFTEDAESHAIEVFASNLRALLSQPPLVGHTVMGIDPGFRTGSKVAVVDPTGKVLDTATIYPHAPQKRWDAALMILQTFVARYSVTLVTVGNGTASRETESLVAELIRIMEDESTSLHYLIISEAGASVYSASPLARAELPDMDVSMRGAVSIARRVQDPLAELVKIDPKSIGVGMYQHDVNQTQLVEALSSVVESVVNNVGVDANTASPALLTHVAGIGPKLAERIVAYRDESGPFANRQSLLKIPGLGPKSYQQAAGFLCVRGGDNPLDSSSIHPESYAIAEAVLDRAGLSPATPPAQREGALAELQKDNPLSQLAVELGTGVPTLTDIFEQLVRPGRDPREDLPTPILRSDVLTMGDLTTDLRLKGTVRNVVDFGAFVDIGVKHDGLLHRTKMPPGTRLQVGDVIDVRVLKVEPERGRISLGWVKR